MSELSEWSPTGFGDHSGVSSFIKKLWTKKSFENNLISAICTIFSKSRFPLNFCTKSHKVCWRSFRVMTDDSHSPPLSSPLPLLQERTTLTFDSHPPLSLCFRGARLTFHSHYCIIKSVSIWVKVIREELLHIWQIYDTYMTKYFRKFSICFLRK